MKKESSIFVLVGSLVPRPSTPPVFDRLQYASDQKLEYASDQKLEALKAWERGYLEPLSLNSTKIYSSARVQYICSLAGQPTSAQGGKGLVNALYSFCNFGM